jgi:hypothetical protein
MILMAQQSAAADIDESVGFACAPHVGASFAVTRLTEQPAQE